MSRLNIEDVGIGQFASDRDMFLASIAVSLKRLADHLAPLDDTLQPPLFWLGDVIRELKSGGGA